MPGIHVFACRKTWMAGTSPAMTKTKEAQTLGRHARLYAGHPRLQAVQLGKTWMAGT
jgi:hypothetical protein